MVPPPRDALALPNPHPLAETGLEEPSGVETPTRTHSRKPAWTERQARKIQSSGLPNGCLAFL